MTSIIRNSMKFMMQEQSWVLYSRTERRQAQTANGTLRESYFGASDSIVARSSKSANADQ